MHDPFDLARFLRAQDPVLDAVRRELRDGRKRSHWMWFVFPQLRGLGRSPTALEYGIASLTEAEAYLAHPLLGPRLVECAELVNLHAGRPIRDILGSPDDLKFHSSMTLFAKAGPGQPVFRAALAAHFGGAEDPRTLGLLRQA